MENPRHNPPTGKHQEKHKQPGTASPPCIGGTLEAPCTFPQVRDCRRDANGTGRATDIAAVEPRRYRTSAARLGRFSAKIPPTYSAGPRPRLNRTRHRPLFNARTTADALRVRFLLYRFHTFCKTYYQGSSDARDNRPTRTDAGQFLIGNSSLRRRIIACPERGARCQMTRTGATRDRMPLRKYQDCEYGPPYSMRAKKLPIASPLQLWAATTPSSRNTLSPPFYPLAR